MSEDEEAGAEAEADAEAEEVDLTAGGESQASGAKSNRSRWPAAARSFARSLPCLLSM
jgi:hypothetical protein